MSNHPISVTGDRSLRDAAKLMQKHNIRRLPVLDGAQKLVGILTRGDILRDLDAQA
jgi:CBS domain-containing protein